MKVKPFVRAYHSPTTKLAYFLQQLLQPLIHRSLQRTHLFSPTDLIQRLNQYEQSGKRIASETQWVTLSIINFDTMVPHTAWLQHLTYFLQIYLPTNRVEYTSTKTGRLQTIHMDTVVRLTELFLEHNLFIYQQQIYRFTKGAPQTFILNELLSIIYLSFWQQSLLDDPQVKGAFFAA